MELILISYPDIFKGETAIVSSLLQQFNFTFHLRKPNACDEDLRKYLNDIPADLHSKIIIHNSLDIYRDFSLKGVHFSTSERQMANQLESTEYKGTSCHSLQEIKSLNADFDYAYLSPIFPSISKKGYVGNLDRNEIVDFLKRSRKIKLIALGGIESEKIEKLKADQFDGVAILGAVWTDDPILNQDKIESNFLEVYSKIHFYED